MATAAPAAAPEPAPVGGRKPEQAKYVPPGRRAQLIRQAEEADQQRRRREADEQRLRRDARREAADRDKWVRGAAAATRAPLPDVGGLSLAGCDAKEAADRISRPPTEAELPAEELEQRQQQHRPQSPSSLGHLMELYDFSGHLHVDDVSHALRRFGGPPRLLYVNERRLLAAFATPEAAKLAAANPPDCLRLRPVAESGPDVAAWLAAAPEASLAPAKPRPETDAGAAARRFIVGHLGGAAAAAAGGGAHRGGCAGRRDVRRHATESERGGRGGGGRGSEP